MKDTRVCHNSEETGQRKIGQTIARIAVNCALQPVSIAFVVSDIDPMGVYKDINVDKNQDRSP